MIHGESRQSLLGRVADCVRATGPYEHPCKGQRNLSILRSPKPLSNESLQILLANTVSGSSTEINGTKLAIPDPLANSIRVHAQPISDFLDSKQFLFWHSAVSSSLLPGVPVKSILTFQRKVNQYHLLTTAMSVC